jgi:hypothetical protein
MSLPNNASGRKPTPAPARSAAGNIGVPHRLGVEVNRARWQLETYVVRPVQVYDRSPSAAPSSAFGPATQRGPMSAADSDRLERLLLEGFGAGEMFQPRTP